MKKIWRRGLPFSPEVAPLVSRMAAVDEYRESLLRLQGVWDSLSMLGQMSGTLPDIAATRSAFQSLTETLLDNLGRCLLTNVTQQMRNQGQVAIDILVRNLFERTADIGFLATDTVLREFVGANASLDASDNEQRRQLEARFAEYAAKYTVYDDIVVLSTDGRVLARLDHDADVRGTHESWLGDALAGAPYVERFGASTVMGGRTALLYAAGIQVDKRMAGVLCLSFRFDGEMEAIFRQLLGRDDPAVVALVDGRGVVVASSDRWQLPLGAALSEGVATSPSAQHRHVRFAGREYLGVSATPSGYEGYAGPGWSARVLVPVEQAFEQREDEDDSIGGEVDGVDVQALFTDELREIPHEARRIQRDLSRVLWNGKLKPASAETSANFTATLLREVGLTGERIRQVFDQATGKLQRSTLSAVFQQAHHHARLAIDIMDRNLYERANDCRWWALDGVLRQTLAQPAASRDVDAAAAVLRRINGLYTVYALLVLFDTEGRVVAVSDPAAAGWQGRTLDAPWVRQTLALRDPQSYIASHHTPTPLYGERATFVFGAAVHAPGSTSVVGGIGIVFDGAPQFEAMLCDSLPQGADTSACGLFVTRNGTVVASSDERLAVGSTVPVPPELAQLARGQAGTTVLDIDGIAFATGFAMAGGYREYGAARDLQADDVAALMMVRLGTFDADSTSTANVTIPASTSRPTAGKQLAVATFLCDGQWLGLPASATLQALQRTRIAAMPNAPAHLLGMMVYENRLLQVVDASQLRSGRATTDVDAPVIVVQASAGQRFALRVDELGPVFDVAEADLQDVSQALSTGNGDRLVRSEQQMLVLLDVDQLMNASGVATAARAVTA
jgi:chemotaxis signal transduction protein